jgi:hypothetical protein
MKKVLGLGVLLLATSLAMAAESSGRPSASGTAEPQQSRSLNGVVMDKSDNPLPNAIVYLKNTKTLTVKTFIAGRDGSYRFPALSPNVDYEVHAEAKGKTSDTKTLSSFDSRPDTRINLHVDVR